MLNASDGAEALQLLTELEKLPDAVLGNSNLNTCYCSLCKTLLAVLAYTVSKAASIWSCPKKHCGHCTCFKVWTAEMMRLAGTA